MVALVFVSVFAFVFEFVFEFLSRASRNPECSNDIGSGNGTEEDEEEDDDDDDDEEEDTGKDDNNDSVCGKFSLSVEWLYLTMAWS